MYSFIEALTNWALHNSPNMLVSLAILSKDFKSCCEIVIPSIKYSPAFINNCYLHEKGYITNLITHGIWKCYDSDNCLYAYGIYDNQNYYQPPGFRNVYNSTYSENGSWNILHYGINKKFRSLVGMYNGLLVTPDKHVMLPKPFKVYGSFIPKTYLIIQAKYFLICNPSTEFVYIEKPDCSITFAVITAQLENKYVITYLIDGALASIQMTGF